MYFGLQLGGKILGWAGASFFAFCAVPQVIQTLREGHARNLSSLFLWMSFGGAFLCAVGTVLDVGVVPWLLFNYSLNFVCVSILLKYKLFPSRLAVMDFHTYTTMRDWNRRVDPDDRPAQDIDQFYKRAIADAQKMGSGQFFGQMLNERDWEKARRPYYNLWPTIIPMLTRLNLDLDSDLIQLPLPALCIRFPKDTAKNPLKFEWKGDEVAVRCIMLGEINEGTGLSVLVDIGEVMGEFGVPIYTYRNFPRRPGLTVEKSIAGLGKGAICRDWRPSAGFPDHGLHPAVLLPVPAGKRSRDHFPRCPGRRPGQVRGQRRPEIRRQGPSPWKSRLGRGQAYRGHPAFPPPAHDAGLDGLGPGGASKIVPRRGSIVHREAVEKLPSGFGGG